MYECLEEVTEPIFFIFCFVGDIWTGASSVIGQHIFYYTSLYIFNAINFKFVKFLQIIISNNNTQHSKHGNNDSGILYWKQQNYINDFL